MRRILVVPAFALLTAVQVLAQEPGQRTRITVDTAGMRWITGTLVTIDSDALVLDVPRVSPAFRVSRRSVKQLQISRGAGRSTVSGAWIGLGMGSLLGLAIGWHADSNVPCNSNGFLGSLCGLPGKRAGNGLLIGAAGGAVLGALIGHFVRTEHWTRVDAEE